MRWENGKTAKRRFPKTRGKRGKQKNLVVIARFYEVLQASPELVFHEPWKSRFPRLLRIPTSPVNDPSQYY